jgi:thiol-disulfide isomerase/thioredoxin
MAQMMKRNVIIIALICVMAGAAVYQNIAIADKQVSLPKEEAPKANFLAPSFSLPGLNGGTYSVGREKRGKALLINFWASWCGPCEMEAPDLVSLYGEYKDQLDIYAVNATKFDNIDKAKAFAEQFAFTFPVLVDKEGEVTELYRVYGFPTSFLVDTNGVIREVIIGILPPEQLEKKIRKVIDGK